MWQVEWLQGGTALYRIGSAQMEQRGASGSEAESSPPVALTVASAS